MSSAIELDKLPRPNVIEPLDYESILAKAKTRFKQLMPDFDANVESDPAVKQLEVMSYKALVLRQRVNDAACALLLPFAQKEDLDVLGAYFGVRRLVIAPAKVDQGIPAIMEDDEDFRYRISIAPSSFTVAGPEAAYEFYARSTSGDVLDASATSPTPGTVLVSVLSRHGDGTAPQTLLDLVAAQVGPKDRRPLTDHVVARSATIKRYRTFARLWTFDGPDPEISLSAATESFVKYRDASRRLGRSVTRAGIIAALKVAGIQDVELDEPGESIRCDRTEAAFCEDYELKWVGVGV